MDPTPQFSVKSLITVSDIKNEDFQNEMDVVEYEPLEDIVSQIDQIIIEAPELIGDLEDSSGLNSYCCQEYFNTFETLLHHMEKFHMGTLRNSIGARKELILKCIDEFDSMLVEEEFDEVEEECWAEEYVVPKSNQIEMQHDNLTFEVIPENSLPVIEFVTQPGKVDSKPRAKRKPVKPVDATPYKCSTCDKVFIGLERFRKHERKHLPPLVCEYCQAEFFHRNILQRHLFKHKADELGKGDNICTFCELFFDSPEQVEDHRIEFHAKNENEIHTCEYCNATFSIKFDLKTHIEKNHGPNKKLSCKYCYKKIPDEETLEAHIAEHDNEENCVCLECGKTFKGKKVLRHHVAYYHSKSGYLMANKNRNWDLQNHEKMHSNLKPFKCKDCPKEFRRATHLKTHIYNVHTPISEKPDHRCLACTKEFKNVESLRKHLKKIHTMTMNEMYKQAGLPYNGRDILSSKQKMLEKGIEHMKKESEGETIEIEVLGNTDFFT
uniref:CSON011985 protein n=1 Tax=Culicoides sonorensis TaxID=179676 RepID=A0A336KP68_CULSO